MTHLTIVDDDRQVSDVEEMKSLLRPYGIEYERWDVEGRVGQDASDEEILQAYEPEISRLKQRAGYVAADVVQLTPETPGLDEVVAKYDKLHTHSDDEVRFTVNGHGIFHVRPEGGPHVAVHVEAGDLINVPAGTRHWFTLCDDRTIRCIRLFTDHAGWAANYVTDR